MIVIDTETTGLLVPESAELAHQPHMTEIAAIKFDRKKFKEIDVFESLIKPPVPIPEHITRATGIDDAMVENAPTFYEIYPKLCKFFLGEKDIVGHNLEFDIGILRNELLRLNLGDAFPFPYKKFCTIELSYYINNKRMKLGDLYHMATGRSLEGAHRAINDARATLICLKYLKKDGAW